MTRSDFAPLLSGVAGLVALLATSSVEAKPKAVGGAAPSACGYRSLPLSVGNSWTYKAGNQSITLKVVGVGTGKDYAGRNATTIDVEETYGPQVTKTQWTCNPGNGLYIPLDSFFFSGEPGGGIGATYNVTSRDRPSLLPEEQLTGDAAWIEIVKAEVTRPDGGAAGAVHPPAKLEVERHAQLKGSEKVLLGLGEFRAQKIVFELRGRAFVEDQKTEIPIKRPATIWVTSGIGFVKLEDAFDKSWELVDTNLVAK